MVPQALLVFPSTVLESTVLKFLAQMAASVADMPEQLADLVAGLARTAELIVRAAVRIARYFTVVFIAASLPSIRIAGLSDN